MKFFHTQCRPCPAKVWTEITDALSKVENEFTSLKAKIEFHSDRIVVSEPGCEDFIFSRVTGEGMQSTKANYGCGLAIRLAIVIINRYSVGYWFFSASEDESQGLWQKAYTLARITS